MSDENICFVDGVEYRAIDAISHCEGCAAAGPNKNNLCLYLCFCQSDTRGDNRTVIWLRADQQPTEN